MPLVESPVAPAEEKKGRGAPKKEQYPALAKGQLTEVPTDWNPKKHDMLKKNNFVNNTTYYEWKGTVIEAKIKRLEGDLKENAEIVTHLKEHGTMPTSDRSKAKRIMNLLDGAESLRAKLAAAGVDLSAIESAIKAEAE